MGKNPVSQEEQDEVMRSYENSRDLLHNIYKSIGDFKIHELDRYSNAAHRNFDLLKKSIENVMPWRLYEPHSPPIIKIRPPHRQANWRTPKSTPKSTSNSKSNYGSNNSYGNSNSNNRGNGTRRTKRKRSRPPSSASSVRSNRTNKTALYPSQY